MNLTDLQEVRKRWKDIPLEVVPKDKVEVFKQRKQAVDMYIDGFTLKEIEEETGIYASRIFPLVKRCMQFDADGNFYGYTALLPGIKIDEMGNSVPHEFGKLLQRYPALADFIEGNWFGNAKYTRKKNMSLAMLHEMFLDECIRVGVPDFGYPFNRKKRGYHALRDYIQHLEKEHLIKSASRQSKDNQQKIRESAELGLCLFALDNANTVNTEGEGESLKEFYFPSAGGNDTFFSLTKDYWKAFQNIKTKYGVTAPDIPMEYVMESFKILLTSYGKLSTSAVVFPSYQEIYDSILATNYTESCDEYNPK